MNILRETVLVVNEYAPIAKSEREALYYQLKPLYLGFAGPTIVAGDFICTLISQPGRYSASSLGRHDYLALRQVIGRVQLSDVLYDAMQLGNEKRAIPAFHAAEKTYFYTLSGGASSSAGLDSLYVSSLHAD